MLTEAGVAGWTAIGVAPNVFADLGDSDDDAVRALVRLRDVLAQKGNLRAAVAFTSAVYRRKVQRLGEQHPDALLELGAMGALVDKAGRTEDATKMLEQAWTGLRSTAGGRDLRLAVVAGNLGVHYLKIGLPMKAEQTLEVAPRIRRDVAPESTGQVAAQLGELLLRREKADEALPLLQEAWDRTRTQYGPSDKRSVARARTLAGVLVRLGREKEAIPVLRIALAAAIEEGDLETKARLGFQLGCALDSNGQREEATRFVDESVRYTRQAGDPHPDLPTRVATYARMVARSGWGVEAEGLLREALEAEIRLYGDDSAEVGARYATLGHIASQVGRRREALGWLEAGMSILRRTAGDAHPQTRFAVDQLARLWIAEAHDAVKRRDHGGAREILMRTRPMVLAVLGPKHHTMVEIESFHLV